MDLWADQVELILCSYVFSVYGGRTRHTHTGKVPNINTNSLQRNQLLSLCFYYQKDQSLLPLIKKQQHSMASVLSINFLESFVINVSCSQKYSLLSRDTCMKSQKIKKQRTTIQLQQHPKKKTETEVCQFSIEHFFTLL